MGIAPKEDQKSTTAGKQNHNHSHQNSIRNDDEAFKMDDIQGSQPVSKQTTIEPEAASSDLQALTINPKDLTNEELEYVIKTGKVPP